MLKKGNKILLIKRKNTGYEDGKFAFPAGHVSENESLKTAMVREAKEEVVLDLKKQDLQFLTVMFKKAEKKYVNFYFFCEKYQGEAQNGEPDKCEEIGWFDIDHLPENMAQIERRIINDYKNNIVLDEYGWED